MTIKCLYCQVLEVKVEILKILSVSVPDLKDKNFKIQP
jgi:hypothetical protein